MNSFMIDIFIYLYNISIYLYNNNKSIYFLKKVYSNLFYDIGMVHSLVNSYKGYDFRNYDALTKIMYSVDPREWSQGANTTIIGDLESSDPTNINNREYNK